MSKVSRAAACIAVLAALFLTGIAVSLPIDSAGAADTCAAAPGAAAPKGQHWYYRVDQVNHRKCWYLHAFVPMANHAAAESRVAPAESVSPAEPSPSDETAQTTNAANAGGELAGTQAAPHVTVLNVKPVTDPPDTAASTSAAGISDQTDETPTASVPDERAKPARPAHVTKARAAADTTNNTDRASLAPSDREGATSAGTSSARLLFALLALALGIAAVVAALLSKMGGMSRAPQLSEHPNDAWRRYGAPDQQAEEDVVHQEYAPFLAPLEPYAAVDLDAPEWLDHSSLAPADIPAAPPRGRPWPSKRLDLVQKDVESRLRILQQPRRGTVPTGKDR
jgi:hypothetical protein